MGYPPKPPSERFWKKVNKNGPIPENRPDLGPCWVWTDALTHGYGNFYVSFEKGRAVERTHAHRFSYIQISGPIPEGLDLDHLCRNRACVNPTHLEPVTRRENLLRGDTIVAAHAKQTHCKHGHEFTPDNTRKPSYRLRGRLCKECSRQRNRIAYWKRKRVYNSLPKS